MDTNRFSLITRQAAFVMAFDRHPDAQTRVYGMCNSMLDVLFCRLACFAPLHSNRKFLQNLVLAIDIDVPSLLYRTLGIRDDVLNLSREHYDASHLEHIVIASDDAADLGQT